jgi:hypothetical protein
MAGKSDDRPFELGNANCASDVEGAAQAFELSN